jgi:hypothetical protein
LKKTPTLLLAGSLVLLAAANLADTLLDHRLQRAVVVLDCVHSMQLAAPPGVSEVDPDHAYEASLDWCNEYLDRAGRRE